MSTVFINGKFTAQRLTGVQRYASQMLRALDEAAQPGERWVLLLPPQGQAPVMRHIELQRVGRWRWPLHAWEQLLLPWAARSGLLINLSGAAPLVARRQWCTFHDAAVFDHPDSYTPAFRRWYRFHFRWLARRAERIVTVSAHSRARLLLRLGLAEARIAVVPNGGEHMHAVIADPAVLGRLGLQGRRWLLAVGSRSRLKNWPALLAAWQQVKADAGCTLVLVGGQDEAVFAPVQAGAPAAQVLHAGAVSDGQLKALMQAEGALGLVFPSLDEGFGLPPLEAMTLGCPVAASRAGALPEVCGDAALYLDPLDGASITAAMQSLIDDAALRARLSQAGPARAAAFTWRASAARLRGLLAGAGAGAQP